MSFQTIVNNYLQKIREDRANPHATPELSLHPHLRDLLKETVAFLNYDFTIIYESTKLDVGRPDFIVPDGLLPVGYVEAEAFGTDLDRLTGHAKTQNERFIKNLDNFILTNKAYRRRTFLPISMQFCTVLPTAINTVDS